MDENPYSSPKCDPKPSFSDLTPGRQAAVGLAAALVGFVVGLPIGWYSLVYGAHGGTPVPTIAFCAPVSLLASVVFHDGLGYAYSMIGGTAVLYAVYAVLLMSRKWPILLGVHGACIAILLLLWGLA